MAVNTLIEGMRDPDPNIRVRCAQTILSRLPAIELPPATDWEVEMRDKAELLAETEDASNDPATLELLDSLGVFKDLEKADRYHQELMDKAIDDLRS
jgi:hypothetical protein